MHITSVPWVQNITPQLFSGLYPRGNNLFSIFNRLLITVAIRLKSENSILVLERPNKIFSKTLS